jgi:adenosylcobinamide-phosphate synthase
MLLHADALLILLIALIVDAVIGDPDSIWRRYPHPVVWIGSLIGLLDKKLNREAQSYQIRRLFGLLALIILLAACGTLAFLLDTALRKLPYHLLVCGILASVLIAQNSLYVHVARVRDAFHSGGLQAARRAVSMIVGRNPDTLDEAGVSRAAIETTAENFSDGVVAPVFWFAFFGLPGLVLYKTINTADSMIGHRSPRYEPFGWAAAKLDDIVNLLPARLAGLLVALVAPLVGGSIAISLKIMVRDAGLHKSPNAGWPEAAMAGALGLALAGPRQYADRFVPDEFLNAEGRVNATPDDISRALRLLVGACSLMFTVVAGLCFLFA